MDKTRSETAAHATDGMPPTTVTLVIMHSPNQLSIETRADGRYQVVTYSFKRTPEDAQPVGSSGSDESTVQQALAEWTGNRLKTSAVVSVNGKPLTKTAIRTLDPSGREMTVETALTIHHGYEGVNAQSAGTVKDVYIRSAR